LSFKDLANKLIEGLASEACSTEEKANCSMLLAAEFRKVADKIERGVEAFLD
jgi:hypothetical protein